MAMKFEPLVTESLAKQIAENIREAILKGSLKIDERLPTEEELAARFEVSRPTIREALKRLAAQHLIRSRRGPTGGTFVNRPSQDEVRLNLTNAITLLAGMGEFDLADIAETRQGLETLCCRLAADRRTESQLTAMAAELDIQSDSKLSDVDFCASDVRFHRILADATNNALLKFIMLTVIDALQPVANMVVYPFRERQRLVAQHQRILTALQARDADTAIAVLTEQIADLRDKYAQALESRRRTVSA
ncbi:MAG TPA: FadR/GntR family transcriptional regulator [Candidatus Competibacteraceae bacterium]|nr:FadR family transcriptional regulator [Candidatus Competibacteraceae bacterium]MCP5134734.1 FadR family transcriptional regulator [Gammaproteobacteria bacterium]HPF59862.1 FadR/GntR family transcriptional regulator [Candidatus Competibacteraceae bacterium]HRY18794.1 FadR/GntR family transcriptional regulator [Candidatus Competibacteraceae bacterium]